MGDAHPLPIEALSVAEMTACQFGSKSLGSGKACFVDTLITLMRRQAAYHKVITEAIAFD